MKKYDYSRKVDGNGAVLLLVNSNARKDYDYVKQTMFAAFNHFGIPFQICDINNGFYNKKQLMNFRCLVIGQDGTGKLLNESSIKIIKEAVCSGLGLISFDGKLGISKSSFLELFQIIPGKDPVTFDKIKTANTSHFITGTRELSDDISLSQHLEILPVENPLYCGGTTVLLKTSSNWPLLMTSSYGKGRVVLFTCSSLLWTKEILGHVSGLDDVFWKSIVWAARKPFAIYPMPPLVTALVDDCSGSYNHFRYVDTMNKYGWIPHLEVYLEDINRVMHEETYADSAKMKTLFDSGLAQFGVHGFTYDNLMWFDHEGRKPLTNQKLKENFQSYDNYMNKWQIKPARYENAHFSEMGRNALPFLKSRGIEYLAPSVNFDTAWLDVPVNKSAFKAPGPYNHPGYYMGHLKEDLHFFILRSKLNPWERFSTDVPPEVDFLWNHTIFWDESPETDIEGAVKVGVKQVRRGVDARFFGNLVCHEQRIAVISMPEWDEILQEIKQQLHKYKLLSRPFDYICDYAKSHHNSEVVAINFDSGSGQMKCEIKGETCVSTVLEIYSDENDGVNCELCDVPQFTGKIKVSF